MKCILIHVQVFHHQHNLSTMVDVIIMHNVVNLANMIIVDIALVGARFDRLNEIDLQKLEQRLRVSLELKQIVSSTEFEKNSYY